jgi:hypothetical protein
MADVTAELRERFEAHAANPDHVEAVIVTLAADAEAAALEAAGMVVERRILSMPIVAGTIDAEALALIERLPGVVRIEPDGEMRALDE